MKTLKGQRLHESDYADVERQLRELFYDLVFRPVVDLLAPHSRQAKDAGRAMKREMRNAMFDPIVAAINSGAVQYANDEFSGEFSAPVSRALRAYGARFNRTTKTFAVLPQQLPVEVLEAAAEYARVARGLHADLQERLDQIERGLRRSVDEKPVKAAKTISKMDKKFDRAYGDALGTEGLSDHARAALDRKYSDSLKPYITKFSNEMIGDLRAAVRANAETGYRFDTLVSRIEGRYGVSASKAEFLARNETALFTAQHRRQRFGDAGVRSYVWRTAGDAEVREAHKHLNGRTFEYSRPPVVDEATGRRANPGEDYNCRCSDEPVIEGVLTNA